MVYNAHERLIRGTPDEVWAQLIEIGSAQDVLWPQRYGPFRLPEGVRVGAPVQHGSLTYRVGTVEPGRKLWFDTGKAISGGHGFTLTTVAGGTLVSHELKGRLGGMLKFLWPVLVRRQHNAVIELILAGLEREVARARAG